MDEPGIQPQSPTSAPRRATVVVMPTETPSEEERASLVRGFRQELESLARAGLDRVPAARHIAIKPAPETAPAVAVPSPFHRPEPALMTVASPSSLLGPVLTESGFDSPPAPACERPLLLDSLAQTVAGCRKCAYLAETRTQTVFGTGSSETRLMFVGEAPGADEDRQGKPFVGRAGQLLTDMITKGMGLAREQVYIANVLKCRPPENRTPTDIESNNCIGYLEEQISIIRPEFICLLGRVALQGLLKSTAAMGKARGKWYYYKGIPTMVTYHPSYLLRKPDAKREVWQDLQMLMKEMGLKPPERKPRAES